VGEEDTGISRGQEQGIGQVTRRVAFQGFRSLEGSHAMRTIWGGWLAAFWCSVLPQVARGQESRFELGQRLRAFEVA
jgi:hypothetical protein